MILNEQLAVTLMSRFLNHLELLDKMSPDVSENSTIKDLESKHSDAVLKNLLTVGIFLGEHFEIKWLGAAKRIEQQKLVDAPDFEESKNQSASVIPLNLPPVAFVVMMDKICKIGRNAQRSVLISSCLKAFAAILISSCTDFNEISEYEPVFLSMLKLIDHVQTFTISRDQSRSKEWRSTLELAGILLDRLKTLLGEDHYSLLNLKLVKSMSAARLVRREEKRQLVLMEPEKAAKLKAKENQKKYRARKHKSNNGGVSKKRK